MLVRAHPCLESSPTEIHLSAVMFRPLNFTEQHGIKGYIFRVSVPIRARPWLVISTTKIYLSVVGVIFRVVVSCCLVHFSEDKAIDGLHFVFAVFPFLHVDGG